MISAPTTLVLGAGASMAYGFPSGVELAELICTALEPQNGDMACLVRAVSRCEPNDPRLLVDEFRRSGLYSLDAFLQRRPEFTAVGKAAIAAALIPKEVEQNLFSVAMANDWFRYLLNAILPPKVEDFHKNQLRVVTFNFDRSFERRLFLALSAAYKLSPSDAAQVTRMIEIVHVHGQLGQPDWLSPAGRPYGVSGLTEHDVALCANQIHLISDELDEREPLRLARQFLSKSTAVCFLGFGYQTLNLQRLRLAEISQNLPTMRGTAFGVPTGERNRILSDVGGVNRLTLYPPDWTIRKFLEEENVIHHP